MPIGILGAGQLGRMLGLAALPLNIEPLFYDPKGNAEPGLGRVFRDAEGDTSGLEALCRAADAVTFEFEHIDAALIDKAGQWARLSPSAQALGSGQHRGREKHLFRQLGIATSAFEVVSSAAELESAASTLGLPLVLKTLTQGYDGKGQALVERESELAEAWQRLGAESALAEAWVAFEREVSIIAVRDRQGRIRVYPPVENRHRDGILRSSIAPAPGLSEAQCAVLEDYAQRLLEAFDYVGVLTLELFQTGDGFLANEIAPRVHNSGHWTIEGAVTSQFENHMRAVAGYPLGDTQCLRPTGMLNIIGGLPDPKAVLAEPDAHLHLYGKAEQPGRKLGHITVQADTQEALSERLRAVAARAPEGVVLAER